MKFVLVDTSVWSLAFRKKRPDSNDKKLIEYLSFLIRNRYAVMIGPIRQEILSGISDEDKFRALKEALKAFPILKLPSRIMSKRLHIIIYVEVMESKGHISII